MNENSNINPRARFLPSVKLKPRQKICKSKQRDNVRFFLRPKLKISDNDSEIPQLISGYYQRFKNNLKKCSSITVSINFKQISQEELEARVAESSKKLKSKTSNKKNRISSQSSYHTQPRYQIMESKQKIKISSEAIFYRLKCIENQRNKSLSIDVKNTKEHRYDTQPEQNKDNPRCLLTILDEDIQEPPKKLKLLSVNKYRNQRIKNWNKSQFSTISTVNISRKSRSKFNNKERIIQCLPQLSKRITPWKNQQQNSQESIQILQNSIQNSILL